MSALNHWQCRHNVGKRNNRAVPPTPTGIVQKWNALHIVGSGDTCGDSAPANAKFLASVYAWNPVVGNTYGTLIPDCYVYLGIFGRTPIRSTRTTTITVGNSVTTPTPT